MYYIMEKLSKIIFGLILVFGFVKPVFALDIYNQQTSQSGVISNPLNGNVLIGTFTLLSDTYFGSDSSFQISTKNTSGFSSCNSGMYLDISTSTVAYTLLLGLITTDFDLSNNFITYTSNFSGTTTLLAGNYKVYTHTQCSGGKFDIVSNSSNNSFFGIISNNAIISNGTRIISVTPISGSTVGTTTVIQAGVYIAPEDYADDLYLHVWFNNQTLAFTGGSAIDGLNEINGVLGLKIPIPFAGVNLLYATTSFIYTGVTTGNYAIRNENILENIPIISTFYQSNAITATTTRFIVVAPTYMDLAIASSSGSLANYILTGTTTPILDCNFKILSIFSGNSQGTFGTTTGFQTSSIESCLVSLVVPPSSIIIDKSKQALNIISKSWPLGYITRIITILDTPATSTLPIFSFTMKTGTPIEGEFSVDIGDNLNQANVLLSQEWTSDNGIVQTGEDEGLWDIMMPYLIILGYLGLVMLILQDLVGISLGRGGTRLFGKKHKMGGITQDEYAYKEKLYEMSQKR